MVVHHSFYCLENTGRVTDKSIGEDDPQLPVYFLQREESRDGISGEALIEDE